MTSYDDQIASVVRAVRILSPTRYAWFGELSPALAASMRDRIGAEAARAYLTYALQSQIYRDFYQRGSAARSKQSMLTSRRPAERSAFVERLAAANTGRGHWDPDWELKELRGNEVMVRQHHVVFRATEESCRGLPADCDGSGGPFRVRIPKHLLGFSPGFYMALGDAPIASSAEDPIVRFYWNLHPQHAAAFVRECTALLNDARLPFRLKVVDDPGRYGRCDAGVLYGSGADFARLLGAVAALHGRTGALLGPAVPALTRRLAPGLAFAEDPGGGNSFGMHRARLIAEGLLMAHDDGLRGHEARMSGIFSAMEARGLDIDHPYLRPGTPVATYSALDETQAALSRASNGALLGTSNGSEMPGSMATPKTRPSRNPLTYIETAARIGRQLCREAVWSGPHCNWMDCRFDHDGSADGSVMVTFQACGPDLYAGAAGIAFFLGALHDATGDAATRRTALGAMRQSLTRSQSDPGFRRDGLYSGAAGTALAAVYLGKRLQAHDLVDDGTRLLEGSPPLHDRHNDVMFGTAGTVLAMLALATLLDENDFIEQALHEGRCLVQAAVETRAGMSWPTANQSRRRNLTGYSHGTAGIAHALLELYAVTGDASFLRTARRAIDYERSWFISSKNNWPDFRSVRGNTSRAHVPCGLSWCHGAPGIAAARLRAYRLTGEVQFREEARIALRTTRETVAQALARPDGDYCLCHGLTGLAEVLLFGVGAPADGLAPSGSARRSSASAHPVRANATGTDSVDLADAQKAYAVDSLGADEAANVTLTHAVANRGIQLYAAPKLPWPTTFQRRTSRSFMLGLAGIGYFYLRLHDASYPSLLLIERERFA